MLLGKTALISGASGLIGSAIAKRLCSSGAHVIGVDVASDALAALESSLPAIKTIVADVSTSEGADKALSAAGGEVDILVNNAGIHDGGAALDELDDEVFDRVMAVNVRGAFLMARRVIGNMVDAKAGIIVNMSSVAGLRGGRTGMAYTTSKWALVGMAQNIAASLGPHGVRAYAVCPGVVAGTGKLGSIPPTARSLRSRGRDRDQPPPTTADDVANLIAFLVSPQSRHINGVAIPIDSGWLAY